MTPMEENEVIIVEYYGGPYDGRCESMTRFSASIVCVFNNSAGAAIGRYVWRNDKRCWIEGAPPWLKQ